jgi:hypothetical protein
VSPSTQFVRVSPGLTNDDINAVIEFAKESVEAKGLAALRA